MTALAPLALGPTLQLALPLVGEAPPTLPEDERLTPWPLFLPLHAELGFTLDVAATLESAKCARFYTRQDNALAQSWSGERCWCNPPWSSIPLWLEKTWLEVRSGCPLVAMLLPADRSDRPWWTWYVEPWRDKHVCDEWRLTSRFLPGRTHFGTPEDPHARRRGRPKCGLVLLLWEATC